MTEDGALSNMSSSLAKRFFYKLSTNLVGLAIGLVTQAIIPRGLGPKSYGDFNFLTEFFNKVIGFFEMGTSSYFFTKVSQRPNDTQLLGFYSVFIGFVSFVVILFVMVLHLAKVHTILWPGQELFFVYMASIFAIFTWMSGLVTMMADAYAITVPAEKIRIFQKIFGLVILLFLYWLNQLNLTQFFLYNYIILLFVICSMIYMMVKKGYLSRNSFFLLKSKILSYGKDIFSYCHPLFIATLVWSTASILDRWWLQVFSGSEQQGFYGFALLTGMAYTLFANAMQPLITREFAIHFIKKDYKQMALVFRRFVPLFYSIAAFFSCFVAIQAEKIIYIMGGDKFSEARFAVIVMAFFPIHQAYGQLSGSVLFATDQTALLRNITIVISLIGVLVTYILLAPEEKLGLHAGAAGLAVKTVFINFIGANIQLYYNAKLLRLKFWRYFGHQIVTVGCFLILAFCATSAVDSFMGFSNKHIVGFLMAGIIYTLISAGTVYIFPKVFGLTSDDMRYITEKIRKAVS